MKILLAVTGASGAIYGLRLLKVLKEKSVEVECIVSNAAKKIIKHEIGAAKIPKCYTEKDIEAPFSSGSFSLDAMVVAPCSMKTLSAIASGFSHNLIARSADVAIKEKKKLVLVPRETPISAIHLENMLKLARLGVIILPAMPGFYHKPRKIEDLVDFVVGKILDSLGIENELYKRWE
ncbi:MAG: UbiX family flavin prenyltransferase [Euryarchaeota archaeon]|nr:UbiX family flavin prenyltransferase [Euryarchaeota archaeon]